uniref:Uncharacterized protein n=1 Tax=Nelumbo nucifera TaxID=4432 RepID=A0A822YFU1_NELNU|nr:TPA_asm: hypothetical protein HUJ06_031566 [Nelumbo nucifera]
MHLLIFSILHGTEELQAEVGGSKRGYTELYLSNQRRYIFSPLARFALTLGNCPKLLSRQFLRQSPDVEGNRVRGFVDLKSCDAHPQE